MENYKILLANTLNISVDDILHLNSVNNDGVITIFITLKPIDKICPYCNSSHSVIKGYYSRKIILPYDNLHNINLVHKVRRYSCSSCKKSFREDSVFTPPRLSVSYSMINNVMKLLLNPNATFSMVANSFNLSTSTVINIFDRYCHIPKTSCFPEVICIDEVYTKHSNFDSKYSCVFYDFLTKEIVDITPSRRKNYLHHYFQTFDQSALDNVKFVCIDMYLPYKDICNRYFKKAIICVDSFHVIKLLNDCLSKLRVRIMRFYDTSSTEYYLLKKWKWLLLSSNIDLDNIPKYNHRLKRYLNYRQLRDLILSIHPDLALAYHLKERYIFYNINYDYNQMSLIIHSIIDELTSSNIPEFYDFTSALINWKHEILNSFILYNGKRISNGIAESLNSKIKLIIYNSKGIYNHDRRRKRIMYSINRKGFSL